MFYWFLLLIIAFRIGERLKGVPWVNLPKKSCEKQPIQERRQINIVNDQVKPQKGDGKKLINNPSKIFQK